MERTYDELVDVLGRKVVTDDWAMLMVLELGDFNAQLQQSFRNRPVAPGRIWKLDTTFDTSALETVSFKAVRFGQPTLSVMPRSTIASDAILRFALVEGTYEVAGTHNGVRYLIEQVRFADGQPYALELSMPLGAIGLRLDEQGRVVWDIPVEYEARVTFGTGEIARRMMGEQLEQWLRLRNLIPQAIVTHTIAGDGATPVRPMRCHLTATPAMGHGTRVAVNLFATSSQLPDAGAASLEFPFLLPKANDNGDGFFNAALFVEPLLKPILQRLEADGTAGFDEAAFAPLLRLLGKEPCLEIDHWLPADGALNVVAFGRPRTLAADPLVFVDPVVAPSIAVRRINLDSDLVDSSQAAHAQLLATRSVELSAHGLGDDVQWSLAAGAPGQIVRSTPTCAQYQIADDQTPLYALVRVNAEGAGQQAHADIVLTPGTLTMSVIPEIARLGGHPQVSLEAEKEITDVQVLGDGQALVDGLVPERLHYFPASVRGYDTDLVTVTGGRSRGYSVIDLRPPEPVLPRWQAVHLFKLECLQNGNPNDRTSDSQYANGRQPVEVTVTVQTGSVKDSGGNINYYPLTESELATLTLVVRGASAVQFLEADALEMEESDPRMFALARERNRYDYFNGSLGAAVTNQDDPSSGTVVRRFYLLTKPDPRTGYVDTTQFVGRFTSDLGQTIESSVNSGGMVAITAVRLPDLTDVVYELARERPSGAEYPAGCTVRYEDGSTDPFSNCLRSMDYWRLSYRPASNAQQVPFLECQFVGDDDQLTPLRSLARWESELMEETYFSYTGYTFRPRLGRGEVDDGAWRSLRYDPWLQWLANTRGHVLEDALAPEHEPYSGQLMLALYRDDDFAFWFDEEQEYQADPHPLKTFTARFGRIDWQSWTSRPRSLRLALTDVQGNRHNLAIGFASDSRNTLQVRNLGNLAVRAEAGSQLHSNAFNFTSYLQSGVDPRTGLYTVGIDLPGLNANALAGPQVPLRLAFNPVSSLNVGYGSGWDLGLTRFEVDSNRILSLYNGQRFKVTGSGGEPAIEEHKLQDFRFYEDDPAHWRVAHIDGRVEHLELMSSGSGRVALPVKMQAPTGHSVRLIYEGYRGQPALKQIIDAHERLLLSIERTLDRIIVRLFPEGQREAAAYSLVLNGLEQVEEIRLPVPEPAGWHYTYSQRNGYTFITQAVSPAGALEHMLYDDQGHEFPPSAGRQSLPRVSEYRVSPGMEQPAQVVTFNYRVLIGGQWRNGNFLGGGDTAIAWSDDGLDNLYKADRDYRYGVEQVFWAEGRATRSVRRVYNAFHLMTEEVTTQNTSVQRQEYAYNLLANTDFRDQPATCQLPTSKVERWESPQGTRSETQLTTYDDFGNLTCESAPTGVVTLREYYPAAGEQGRCPADPYGFARHLKQTRVQPAKGTHGFEVEGLAPERVQRFTYQQAATLPGADKPHWVALHREEHCVLGHEQTPYREMQYQWYEGGDLLLLGRAKALTTTYYDLPATTGLRYRWPRQAAEGSRQAVETFTYSLDDGSDWIEQQVLKTRVHLIGFDGTEREVTEEASVLSGQPLLVRDDNDVETRYRYDALQRVVEEIYAPGTEDQSTLRYTYGLAQGAEPAWQVRQDAEEVQLTTYTDGLGRAVQEWRAEPGQAPQAQAGVRPQAPGMQIYQARFDELGQLIEETVFDDLQATATLEEWAAQPMTTAYEYDDWGKVRASVGPEGVREVEQFDPIGDGQLPRVKRWQESTLGSEATAVMTTVNTLFGTALSEARQGPDGVDDVTTYGYDGLGRKVRETRPWAWGTTRETRFEVDVYDRDCIKTLPGGAQVERQYALHSDQDLPETIHLDSKLLGTQTFDGLGRMIASQTGGRDRTMAYQGSESRPRQVVTPKQHLIEYDYKLRVGQEPIRRTAQADETYTYDFRTARLLACHKQGDRVLERSYFTNGQIRSEQRLLDGRHYEMNYRYSVGQQVLQYTDVANVTQRYGYDAAGRLCNTVVGSLSADAQGQPQWIPGLSCELAYDRLGRSQRVHTVDHSQPGEPYLTTELMYDSLGRETERHFDINGVASVLAQTYDDADCITRRTLTEQGRLLREEEFEYDLQGHLSWYSCQGPECPVDPYGKTISAQLFIVDELDNHLYVDTAWASEAVEQMRTWHRQLRSGAVTARQIHGQLDTAQANEASYFYDNPLDPAQLTRIENTAAPDYPAVIELEYDADGNLIRDDRGRSLDYDVLGRLVKVSALPGEEPSIYQYDPNDIICARSDGGRHARPEHRFYQAGQLATLVQGEKRTAIVRAGDHLIAETDDDPQTAPHGEQS